MLVQHRQAMGGQSFMRMEKTPVFLVGGSMKDILEDD